MDDLTNFEIDIKEHIARLQEMGEDAERLEAISENRQYRAAALQMAIQIATPENIIETINADTVIEIAQKFIDFINA